jgi:uncharacterized membrane protein YphA (DoxX/SURF4 family)
MLNPFPDLLVLSYFAPTLLRIGAACVFFYMAYVQSKRRHEIEQMHFPLIGASKRIPPFAAAFNVLIGGMLIFGYYTQIAALLAVLASIKLLVLGRWYPRLVPVDRAALVLLTIMCLSLLITGAGAYAYDLPL